MKSLKVVLVVVLSIAAAQVEAATSLNPQHLSRVDAGWGGEGIYISTTEGQPAEGCGPRMIILPNTPLFKENVAPLLSAFRTGAPVVLYVDGCFSANTMTLKAVSIVK